MSDLKGRMFDILHGTQHKARRGGMNQALLMRPWHRIAHADMYRKLYTKSAGA